MTINAHSDIARRMVDWHRRRFPSRTNERPLLVALKMCEEAGELCSAVLASWTDGDDGKGIIEAEAADVLACLLVLADDYGFDLFQAAEQKLAVLEQRLLDRLGAPQPLADREEP